jgi:hypothetical protein
MAKISNVMRKTIFENAINQIYGDRLVTEKAEFEKSINDIVVTMVKRIAKENGVNYSLLISSYKPYVETSRHFYYRTDKGKYFTDELKQIFYNEHSSVLNWMEEHFVLLDDFIKHNPYYADSEEPQPQAGDETFNGEEKKEIIAAFKKYADFMKQVISAARPIRDLLIGATTTNKLIELSPELGELIPEPEPCVALVPVDTVKKVSALFRNK